jgi:hypothetical protein
MIIAVSTYSIEGLAGMSGRIVFRLLGDRFGAMHLLVPDLLAQAFGARAYYVVHALAGFYTVAALFGFIYAGVMPLHAVLARENFPMRMMGTVIGRHRDGGQPGHGDGPGGGRLDPRHLRQLRRPLSRGVRPGPGRLRDDVDLPPVSEGKGSAPAPVAA